MTCARTGRLCRGRRSLLRSAPMRLEVPAARIIAAVPDELCMAFSFQIRKPIQKAYPFSDLVFDVIMAPESGKTDRDIALIIFII
jgi:hypothetical protein